MGGLVGRYIFRQAAGALVLILGTLTLIVWLTSALQQLKLMTAQGQGFLIFLKITLLALPTLMAVVAPVALLIAVLYTLSRLSGDSEIIVLSAAGGSVWRIAQPYLVLAGGLAAILWFANAYVLPSAARQLRDYIVQVRTDLVAQVLQPGSFSSPEPGLTFHIRDKDISGDLLGVIVDDARDAGQPMTYLAERATVLKEGDTAALVMRTGHIHRIATDTGAAQIVTFDSYVFDITQFGPKEGRSDLKPRERYIGELVAPPADDGYAKRNRGKFRAELHDRIASPLYPLAFVLIALVHLGRPRTTRDGRFGSLAAAFAVCTGLRLAGLAAVNLAAKNGGAVALVYAIPVGAMLLATLMLARGWHPPRLALPALPQWRRALPRAAA